MASLDDMTVNITFVTNLITMDKKYQTRDGRAVEILRTNVKSVIGFPIIGIITERDGSEEQDRWTADGHYYGNRESERDLIPVPTKHEMWGIIEDLRRIGPYLYVDRETAKVALVGHERLARVTWED